MGEKYTDDWDVYVPPRHGEHCHINEVLEDTLDMPLLPLGRRGENFVQTYPTRQGVLQFHLAGPGFPRLDDAEKRAATAHTETGLQVRCMSAEDLLALE